MNRRYAESIVIALLWTPVLARGQNPPHQHPNPQSQQAGVTKSVEETNDAFAPIPRRGHDEFARLVVALYRPFGNRPS